jgi:hypothetical protein
MSLWDFGVHDDSPSHRRPTPRAPIAFLLTQSLCSYRSARHSWGSPKATAVPLSRWQGAYDLAGVDDLLENKPDAVSLSYSEHGRCLWCVAGVENGERNGGLFTARSGVGTQERRIDPLAVASSSSLPNWP